MSRQITLSQIQVKNLKCFELAFEKYAKELVQADVQTLPVFQRHKESNYVLGNIRLGDRNIANLLFVADPNHSTPQINEKDEIINGHGVLSGDEDYLNGRFGVQNPINHDRLDTYYMAEGSIAVLNGMGFHIDGYIVDENNDAEYIGTREVEEVVAGSTGF